MALCASTHMHTWNAHFYRRESQNIYSQLPVELSRCWWGAFHVSQSLRLWFKNEWCDKKWSRQLPGDWQKEILQYACHACWNTGGFLSNHAWFFTHIHIWEKSGLTVTKGNYLVLLLAGIYPGRWQFHDPLRAHRMEADGAYRNHNCWELSKDRASMLQSQYPHWWWW